MKTVRCVCQRVGSPVKLFSGKAMDLPLLLSVSFTGVNYTCIVTDHGGVIFVLQTVTEKHKLNVPETMTEVLDVSDEEGECADHSCASSTHLRTTQ